VVVVQRQSVLQLDVHFPPLLVVPGPRLWLLFIALAAATVFSLTVGKDWLEDNGLTSEALLKYLSIPLVSTVFTYLHIWAALYMTFYPLEYRGCCRAPGTNVGLGWQGIVPFKAEKMARTSVELMTTKVANVRDVFERIDPGMVAQELEPILQGTLTHIIEEVALQEEPILWSQMPATVKNELIMKAREDAPPVVEAMLRDVKENVESMFDLSDMVVKAFLRNPELLNHMFIECGYAELKFIRDCGAYMGAAFGIIQVALWIFYSAGWMLPTFGLVVGLLSNWIALKMIFEPVEPIYLLRGRLKLQGLFLKRQREVSQEYARIVSSHVLSSRYLIPAILCGPNAEALFDMVFKHLNEACDRYAGMSRHAITLFRGTDKYEGCRQAVSERIVASLPEFGRYLERQLDSAMDLETLFAERMSAMSSKDFEQLLHPVFQEDEWKLVLMGGALGVVVGCFQWVALGS